MSDHVVLYVDRLIRPESVQEEGDGAARETSGGVLEDEAGPSCSAGNDVDDEKVGEDEPLLQVGECRICQEEDSINNLETPCACSGSLKLYILPSMLIESVFSIGAMRKETLLVRFVISGGWTISGTPLDLHDPRLLAIAEAERQFLEAEYDEYDASNASGSAFCRSAALILMALLLLRHALAIPDADGEDDVSTFFSLFLLRAAGFLLPCYIMAWAINILQRRRQRQEAAALAATQVAFVLQSGQRRGLQFTIASGSNLTATQPQEPV
ncbi:RING-CH-type domain-containing protein [Citrus sinensis]|uniref:RING-CH-type domain-containing protein n=1 Tax=Citrus sinensis TaxID=2711 RepID=A0ACB8LKS3_CITSI|nr:RING-CH-type domain-containing protein [Citrus sinensis]